MVICFDCNTHSFHRFNYLAVLVIGDLMVHYLSKMSTRLIIYSCDFIARYLFCYCWLLHFRPAWLCFSQLNVTSKSKVVEIHCSVLMYYETMVEWQQG